MGIANFYYIPTAHKWIKNLKVKHLPMIYIAV